MTRLSAWLLSSGIEEGPVFRRINVLATKATSEGQQIVRQFIGAKPLTARASWGYSLTGLLPLPQLPQQQHRPERSFWHQPCAIWAWSLGFGSAFFATGER